MLGAVARDQHVDDGHPVAAGGVEPWPGAIVAREPLRDRGQPIGLEPVLEPVAEADEMERDRLSLTPIVVSGMLNRVDVDAVAVNAAEGDVAELAGQQLAERRPACRRCADVGMRLVDRLRQVSGTAPRAGLGDPVQVVGGVDVRHGGVVDGGDERRIRPEEVAEARIPVDRTDEREPLAFDERRRAEHAIGARRDDRRRTRQPSSERRCSTLTVGWSASRTTAASASGGTAAIPSCSDRLIPRCGASLGTAIADSGTASEDGATTMSGDRPAAVAVSTTIWSMVRDPIRTAGFGDPKRVTMRQRPG